MLRLGGRWLLRHLLPPACPLCLQTLPADWQEPFCASCSTGFVSLPAGSCSCCSLPFVAGDSSSHLCGRCLKNPPPFDKVYAVGSFSEGLRDAVHRFKFNQRPGLDRPLGILLHRALPTELDAEQIVPVPLNRRRLRKRGYNQALLLARELGRLRSLPVVPALEKCLETDPQQELSAEAREVNLNQAFRAKFELSGAKVLLVDDVLTTGATARACSLALLAAGAASVRVAVVGRR